MQRKTEKASMPTKSCIDCREKNLEIRDKDSEIRELKENVMKLEMEKAEVIHLLVSALLSVIHAFYGSSNLAMSNICLLWLSVIILIIFFFLFYFAIECLEENENGHGWRPKQWRA